MHLKTSTNQIFYSVVISDGHKNCLCTDCSSYFLPGILRDHAQSLLLRILRYTSIFQTPHPWGKSLWVNAEQIISPPLPRREGVVGLNIDRRIRRESGQTAYYVSCKLCQEILGVLIGLSTAVTYCGFLPRARASGARESTQQEALNLQRDQLDA